MKKNIKKVLASLLVLASLASVSAIVSFADERTRHIPISSYVSSFPSLKLPKNCYSFDKCFEETIDSVNKDIEHNYKGYPKNLYKNESIEISCDKAINKGDIFCKDLINQLNHFLYFRNLDRYFEDEAKSKYEQILGHCNTKDFQKEVLVPLVEIHDGGAMARELMYNINQDN